MTLSPAALVHAELLAAMHRVCFKEPWSAQSMAEIIAMPGAQGLIAEEGGQPAGMVLWRVAVDEAEILVIAALPPWRRRGLGRRLLEAAMAASAQSGACAMFLEAAADNLPALGLYQASGFRQVGLRRGYYGGVDAVAMRRNLDGTPVSAD